MTPQDTTAAEQRERRRWKQVVWLSAGAIALFVGIRLLPTGTNLSHMDFRAKSSNPVVFCDPLDPQFIPVSEMRSPVSLSLHSAPAKAGEPLQFTVELRSSSGKPVGPADLLVVHTRKLHLLVVDPTLADYQHLHPKPGSKTGEWVSAFTPKSGGVYRIFADFTPAATGRGLYAGTDLIVQGAPGTGLPGLQDRPDSNTATLANCDFTLEHTTPVRARQATALTLHLRRQDGAPIELGLVMGTFAHLVAFDETRSGFAHLHPDESDLTRTPDPLSPRLGFKVTLPHSGRYVIWAQLNLEGHECFVLFWFTAVY